MSEAIGIDFCVYLTLKFIKLLTLAYRLLSKIRIVLWIKFMCSLPELKTKLLRPNFFFVSFLLECNESRFGLT